MDFDERLIRTRGYGCYEPIDTGLLPSLYIAYRMDLSEPSEIFHNNIRERFQRGDGQVIEAMAYIADLASKAKTALLNRDYAALGDLMNKNFDKRRSIYNLSPRNIRMVELARSLGASAKFAGSGGAIVGIYENEAMYERLREAFKKDRCEIFKPIVE